MMKYGKVIFLAILLIAEIIAFSTSTTKTGTSGGAAYVPHTTEEIQLLESIANQ